MNIAYICFCPFHFEVFREVYKRLDRPRPDIVVTRTGMDPDGRNVKDTIALLEKDSIPFVLHPRKKYDIVISCHLLDPSETRRYSHKGTRFIRMLYSTIGKNYTYSEGNRLYDLILTIGDYSKKRLQQYAECISVGMPRYDKLLSGGYDKKALRAEYGLDDARPVLVYLPTWSDQCTIEKFGTALVQLAEQYQIVIKPHPLTYLCETERLAVFQGKPVRLIEEDCPIDKLMAMADLIITDYSSTIFEAAAANIPMLLLDLPQQDLDQSAMYSSDDPEHRYRNIAVSLRDPKAVAQAVQDALSDGEPWTTLRNECADHFFACRDGTSAEKAEQAIQKVMSTYRGRILLGRWKSRLQAGRDRLTELYDKGRPRLGIGRHIRRILRR